MRKFVAAVLVLWAATVGQSAEPLVPAVEVRGAQRVEADLVLQTVTTRAGEPYDPQRLRADIRALFALGFFADVAVEREADGTVVFVVRERPALREWRLEGAQGVDKEDLDKAVLLKRREVLDGARVEAAAQAIRDLYREKGFYLVAVTSEVQAVPDDKNQVDVVFRVGEGEKVRVKSVNLLGVEAADEADLRQYLAVSEAGFWSWLTDSGTFKEADLDRDREMIRAYYLNRGHVDIEVGEPLVSLTADRRWLKIDLPLREGAPHTLGAITFTGDLEFPEEKLRATAKLVEGELFRSEDFRKAHQLLADLYGDIGYAFAEIEPRTRVDPATRTVAVEYAIHKGELMRLGRIGVRGNTKTRDRIVRREMRLAEGDVFSGTGIRKSRRRIQNLGFFETVNLATNRRPGTDLVDVDIQVEEKPTGAFSVGAGYSSVDKIIGMAQVSQRNFLGLGYQLSAAANFGSAQETYNLTFNNPRVYDTEVYGGIDLYKALRGYSDYDKHAVGGALKFGTTWSEAWKSRWIYRYEVADVKNVDPAAAQLLLDQRGKTVTSSLTSLLLYDTRDNPWEPHDGAQAEGSVEWAGGLLGGDSAYLKYGLDASKYVPLWWNHVLTLHGRVGFVHRLADQAIPVYERYTLGGINTVRGFDSRSIGPRDGDDVIGGDKELLLNLEYLFPLVEEAKIRGVVFIDAGNAWAEGKPYLDTPLRRSMGAGVRWFSPMGPLRLEWGYVLDRKSGEEKSQWEFSIGGFF